MDIVVRITRHVVVDHQLDGRDVESARGDVRGDEDPGCGGAEAGEVRCALGLRKLGVEGGDAVVESTEQAFEDVGCCGAVAEDDDGFLGSVLGCEKEDV